MASANVGGSGGSGRRKSLDAEINLVPFIDLLSMCICFLLMTAVWTQLSSVQVKQANGTEGAADTKQTFDLDVKFVSSAKMTLTLKHSGKTLKTVEASGTEPAIALTALDSQLKSLKAGFKPGQEISAVMLTPKEGVDYGTLVSVMDVFRKNKLVNLGVVPVANAGGSSPTGG